MSNTNGNDNKNGTSQATAWKTIAKVNSQAFSPGDSVLFKKGDIWRETLEIQNSGTSESYLYFGTYGTGANAKIYGSELATTWTSQGGNVWKSDDMYTNPHSNQADIHFILSGNIYWGHYKPDVTSLATEFDWTWSSNYVYVYSVTDPFVAYDSIELPQRFSCIDTYHKEYLHFNGIDVKYARYIGYDDNNSHSDHIDISGLIIENCEISHIGGITTAQAGFGAAVVYSDLVIRNCTIHDCGRRGISLDIYGNGFTASNAVIENNTIYGGFHTTGVDLSVGSGGFTGSWNGVQIRNNTFSDTWGEPYIHASNQIFLQNWAWNTQNAKAENIFIYNNIFRHPNFSAINMEGMSNIFVYNNVFYEVTVTDKYVIQLWIDANNTNIKVKNNIFYSTSPDNNFGISVFCLTQSDNVDLDFNLFYRNDNSLTLVRYKGQDYFMNTITTDLVSDLGWERNGPEPADPLFVPSSDYKLQTESPAIGAGINVGIEKDFDGNYYNDPPSVGAYEGNPVNPPPPSGSDLSILVYPNPGSNMINVTINGFDVNKQLIFRILNLSGGIVYEDRIEPGKRELSFTVSLNPGAYVVIVQDDNFNLVGQKLIIV